MSATTAPVTLDYAALCQHLERAAETEQQLGDDYSELGAGGAWDSANQYWGAARAYRQMLQHVRREAEAQR